jgi:hypothetical protein
VEIQETKNLLKSKENGHQIKDTFHRKGCNLWQLYISQGINNQRVQSAQKKPLNSQRINDPLQK